MYRYMTLNQLQKPKIQKSKSPNIQKSKIPKTKKSNFSKIQKNKCLGVWFVGPLGSTSQVPSRENIFCDQEENSSREVKIVKIHDYPFC